MSDPRSMAESVRQVRQQLQDTRPEHVAPDLPDDLAAEVENGRREAVWQRWVSVVPSRFRGATLDYDGLAPIRDDLAGWAADPAGRNLLLFGPVGVGKTSAAFAACGQLLQAGAAFDFMPQAELIDGLDWRRPESGGLLERLCDVAYLFVDDLACDDLSSWAAQRLYVVLNRRWMEARPTVATSNLTPDQLAEALGERSYSRLVGNDAVVLRLAGEDRRRRP